MFSTMTSEVARVRQADLLATAQHQRLVRQARNGRTAGTVRTRQVTGSGATAPSGRLTASPRHLAAAFLMATARRLEPVRRNLEPEAISVAPELPCAAEPC